MSFFGTSFKSLLTSLATELESRGLKTERVESLAAWIDRQPIAVDALRSIGLSWENPNRPEHHEQDVMRYSGYTPNPLPMMKSRSSGTVLVRYEKQIYEVEPVAIQGPARHPQTMAQVSVVGKNQIMMIGVRHVIPEERPKFIRLLEEIERRSGGYKWASDQSPVEWSEGEWSGRAHRVHVRIPRNGFAVQIIRRTTR